MKDSKKIDNEIVENLEETKGAKIKKIILWVLFVIVSVVGVLFFSTYVRWISDISTKHQILYYGQEQIRVDEVVDYYGTSVKNTILENEALLLYCNSEYGGDCLTADYNNSFDNLLRSPLIAINIVLLIDLVLLFLIFKKVEIKKWKKIAVFVVVLGYGLFNLGLQGYKVVDYYMFVNDNENVAEATIVRGIITENKNEFYPVVKYQTEKGEFIQYIDYGIEGNIDDKLNSKINIYYDLKDNEKIDVKRNMINYIIPIFISLIFIGFAIIYLIINKDKE